jgi:hypothetical protein
MLKATSDQPILELLVRSTIRCQFLDEISEDGVGGESNSTGVYQYAILHLSTPMNGKMTNSRLFWSQSLTSAKS